MSSTYTDNLKLVLPATGELDGTWGTVVNAGLTSLVDEALAGMASLSSWTANAMTITTTDGASSSGRCMMLSLTGTLSATGTLTVPTAKKMYIVRNNTTGGYSVTVKMAAGTTVSVPNGQTYLVYADGTNVEVCMTGVTLADSLKSNATTGKMQITGPAAGSTRVMTIPDANATLLTTNAAVTVAQGGTGATTLTLNNVLLGNGTSAPLFVAPGTTGNVLTSDGTTWVSSTPTGGTATALKSNATTGVMQIVGPAAASTRVMTIPDANATILTSAAAVTVAQGGTGATTLTLNNVLLGNGTSAPQFVAPGASGNILTSNGTTWSSAAPAAVSGLTVAQGGTGAASFTANSVLLGNGTSAFQEVAPGASGNILQSNGTTWTSAAPGSGTVPAGGTTGQALTKVNATDYNTTWSTVGDVTTSGTQTLTNKRITPRVNSTTTDTTPLAWNSDSYDVYALTAQAEALTISADAGTPTDGQKMMFRFKDNGTARALTWTTGSAGAFRAIGITLPTTTVLSKIVYVGCIYNAADSRWDAIATAQEA